MLSEAGHEVILLREQLAPDSPDPLVAAVSEMNGAVLVSLDSDLKRLAPPGSYRQGEISAAQPNRAEM